MQKMTNAERRSQKNVLNIIKQYDEPYTYKHCMRTGKIASLLASRLGKTKEECEIVRMAGEIHDIGKVKIDKDLLYKNGRYTDEEFYTIKGHALNGTDILKAAGLDRQAYYDAAKEHHAFYEPKNGGYGAKSYQNDEHPSEIAQIMAIADVYEALSAKRPYKDAFPTNKVRQFMDENLEKGQFNPDVYDVFMTELFDSLERERLMEQTKGFTRSDMIHESGKVIQMQPDETLTPQKCAEAQEMEQLAM